MNAIECQGVMRRFGEVKALAGVDLHVADGELFGIVGPNGSGKTTLFNCLQGLDRPDGGQVRVLGLEPLANRAELSRRMGVQLQSAALIPRLKVREALQLFASLYPSSRDIDTLLGELGIAAKAKAFVDKLSGGERQRVFIALALLHEPELLFFDELTTAVDPQARQAIWGILRNLRDGGRTIVLTTHLMEEAEALCDRVAIINAGRIIALGTPTELIAAHGGAHKLRVVVAGDVQLDRLRNMPGIQAVMREGEHLEVSGTGDFALTVVGELREMGVGVSHMEVTQPSLDEVFLTLTGREMREGAQ
ncbi:MAG: ABC transporter ATP-binding protein [Propionibacteriaceae bacterium]|nr:ABC transporter ATP-binding protein [Propionibacteriaceae bacterium]